MLLPGERALVFAVDDEPHSVDLLIRTLRKSYDVRGFTDPAKAIEAALELDPLVMVVDYRMPGLNGLELVQKLRQKGLSFSVLMVTAFPEMDEVLHAAQSKLLFLLIPKPLKPSDLLAQVDNAVAEEVFKRFRQQERLLFSKPG